MQFRVIVVTDPQTNKHSHKPTNRQDRLQYTAPLSLARHVTIIDVGLLGTTLEANDSYCNGSTLSVQQQHTTRYGISKAVTALLMVAVQYSGSALVSISDVILRIVRLVMGWAIVYRCATSRSIVR